MTRLYLLRHGQTAVNAAGRMQGRIDEPLDLTGRDQVVRAAAAIGIPDLLVSSPLLRARETADAFGIPYDVDERWSEMDYGDLDGQRLADVDPGVWASWRADSTFRPPGGETLPELDRRVAEACQSLALRLPHGRVVVTTHVTPIKSAVVWALGGEASLHWRLRLDQATLTRIEIGPTGPVLVGFNEAL